MKLLVDIGNSRIKYCFSEDECFFQHAAFEYSHADLQQSLDKYLLQAGQAMPDRILVASVAGDAIAERFRLWCQQSFAVAAEFASVSRSFDDLIHAYQQPQQFGVDRWMAMIAARSLTRSDCLVVDCGTATTLDAIKADGRHLGGMITPGATLMVQTLIDNTQAIQPVVSDGDEQPPLFGLSTQQCLQLGARQSIIALIETVYHKFQRLVGGQPVCVITGGGIAAIIDGMSIEYQYLPDLVLQGLKLWGEAA